MDNLFDTTLLSPSQYRHPEWINTLQKQFNKKHVKILEVGSRKVVSSIKDKFNEADYTGFDIYDGENVDIVGDAHKLGSYFSPNSFDLIISSAVFEHLALRWIVAKEMIKLLKNDGNGYVFIETHFSFGVHERPWHFFQFSDKAMEVLFPEALGIKKIACGFSNPLIGIYNNQSASYLRGKLVGNLFTHVEFFGQKINDKCNEIFGGVGWYVESSQSIQNIVNGEMYPPPKK